MKYQFTLPDFPNANFEMEISTWLGKQTLYKDDVIIERSNEKGKPFLIPGNTGEIVKAYSKPALPDMVPVLEIDNTKHRIAEKLPWYQLALALLPILLLFKGGGLGGGIGGLAFMINLKIFRKENAGNIKYLKVIGISLCAAAVYFLLAAIIFNLIN